jgi:hypothetical protein
MANIQLQDSASTWVGGRNGFVIGAIAGALIASLIATLMVHLDAGAGGPGLHAMGGAAFGGMVGLFIGMLAARRRRYTRER